MSARPRADGMSPSTVAVTGATGFIGRHLLRTLVQAGHHVRALTRGSSSDGMGLADDQVTWIPGSLSQKESLRTLVEGSDAVVHCAGAIKALSRGTFLEMNGTGTANLIDAAVGQSNPPRFVHVSSLAAREPRLSPYAASKRLGEQMAWAARGKLPVTILRPPAVYGPGDMETLRIFKMAARGFVPATTVAGARTSLAHVNDVVGAVVAALALDAPPNAPVEFDDGHPHGYTWAEIAMAAGAALQTSPRLIPVPASVLYLAGAMGSLGAVLSRRPTVLSWSKVPELLHPDWVAAPCTLPGYNPLWNIEKGFKDAVDWYASRGLLTSNG